MEGGIAILLLLVIVVGGGIAVASAMGGAQALRHRPKGDLGSDGGVDGPRPTHTVAEPTDEHAAGYGVGGEYGDEPRPARVQRGS
jgi:hypothetical protein